MARLLALPTVAYSLWAPLYATPSIPHAPHRHLHGAWASPTSLLVSHGIGVEEGGSGLQDTWSMSPVPGEGGVTPPRVSSTLLGLNASSPPAFLSVSSATVYLKWVGGEGGEATLLHGIPATPPAPAGGSVWVHTSSGAGGAMSSTWEALPVSGPGEKDAFAWAHQACAAVPLRDSLGEGLACFGGLSTTQPGVTTDGLWLAHPSSSGTNSSGRGLLWDALVGGGAEVAGSSSVTPHPRYGASLAYTVRGAILGAKGGVGGSEGIGGGVRGAMEHSLWMFGGVSEGCDLGSVTLHGNLTLGVDVLGGKEEGGKGPCVFGDLWRYTWVTEETPSAVPLDPKSPLLVQLLGPSLVPPHWQRVTTMEGSGEMEGNAVTSAQEAVLSWVSLREAGAESLPCSSSSPPPPPAASAPTPPTTQTPPHPSPRTMASLTPAGRLSLLLFGGALPTSSSGAQGGLLSPLPSGEPLTWTALISPLAIIPPTPLSNYLAPSSQVGLVWVPHCNPPSPVPLPGSGGRKRLLLEAAASSGGVKGGNTPTSASNTTTTAANATAATNATNPTPSGRGEGGGANSTLGDERSVESSSSNSTNPSNATKSLDTPPLPTNTTNLTATPPPSTKDGEEVVVASSTTAPPSKAAPPPMDASTSTTNAITWSAAAMSVLSSHQGNIPFSPPLGIYAASLLPFLTLEGGEGNISSTSTSNSTTARTQLFASRDVDTHKALTLALATYSIGVVSGEEEGVAWLAALSAAEEGDVPQAVAAARVGKGGVGGGGGGGGVAPSAPPPLPRSAAILYGGKSAEGGGGGGKGASQEESEPIAWVWLESGKRPLAPPFKRKLTPAPAARPKPLPLHLPPSHPGRNLGVKGGVQGASPTTTFPPSSVLSAAAGKGAVVVVSSLVGAYGGGHWLPYYAMGIFACTCAVFVHRYMRKRREEVLLPGAVKEKRGGAALQANILAQTTTNRAALGAMGLFSVGGWPGGKPPGATSSKTGPTLLPLWAPSKKGGVQHKE